MDESLAKAAKELAALRRLAIEVANELRAGDINDSEALSIANRLLQAAENPRDPFARWAEAAGIDWEVCAK